MAVNRKMPRVQEILFPVLRDRMPDVTFTSWGADVDDRVLPFVNIRRLGGFSVDPALLDRCIIEMTAYSGDGLVDAENIYLDARHVIWEMVRKQIVTDAGWLTSFQEVMGPTQFDSNIEDVWRIQGLIQLGLRPRRS